MPIPHQCCYLEPGGEARKLLLVSEYSSRKLNQSASMRRLLFGLSGLSGFLVERN